MHSEIHPGFAVAFAVVHIALPFEVIDSSLFLVDLPAAVAVLLCLSLVKVLSRPDNSNAFSVAARGTLAGLVGLEGYLLRENVPVLLLPAFVLFLRDKNTRGVAVWAGMILAAGIGLEQALYIVKGLGWGFRWAIVEKALENYSPFLPVYTLSAFPLREFTYLLRHFHGWPDGVFAVVFYATALVVHVVMLFQSQSSLLRALALTGLTTWAIFSFGIVERVGDSVRALAPPILRYFQLFFYTAIVSLCWGACWLYRAASDRLSTALSGEPRVLRTSLLRAAIAAIGFAVFGLAFMSLRVSTYYVPNRFHQPGGDLRATLRAIDRLAETSFDKPLNIYGTSESLRVVSIFRGPWSSPPVVWHRRDIAELAELVKQRVPSVWFRDESRERLSLRY
ncbi:MAG: hypothetical protein HYZ72_00975, partial [Deltaproteobacteria bacterium]|nr:hypothetical protein [Deltaproteobacteria bacterium]